MAVPRACCLCVCVCVRLLVMKTYLNIVTQDIGILMTYKHSVVSLTLAFAVSLSPSGRGRAACVCGGSSSHPTKARPPPTKARLPAAHPFGSPCAGVRDVAWEQRRMCAPGVRAQVTETCVGCAPPRFSHDDHSNPPILLRSPADENLSNIKQRSSDSKKW